MTAKTDSHVAQRIDADAQLRVRVRRPAGRVMHPAMVLATLVLVACAARPPENPDARACLPPENPAMRDKNYNFRLAGYTQRADAFATCMTEHGYVLDYNELEERLTHFEQVKNANVMGGDPIWAMRIEEQVLRTDPELWKRPQAPGTASPASDPLPPK